MIQEPLPWLEDDDADPTLRRLLGSARGDAPSSTALRAAPAAIATLLVSHGGLAASAAVTAAGGAAAATSTSTATALVLGKWFGIGALLGTASVATITATKSAPERPAASAWAPPVTRAPAPSARLTPPRVETAASVAASVAPPPEVQSAAPRSDLALEVRLLDEARAALAAGAPERTLRVLSRVEALPARMLVPESVVLRVRALLAAGRVGEARRVGGEFLRRAPSSPQASVLRALLAEAEAP